MKKVRLGISYTILLFTLAVYVVSNSYMYQLQIEQNSNENEIENLKQANDELSVEINMKNSQESVSKDYPQLKFNNNVFFLENDEE